MKRILVEYEVSPGYAKCTFGGDWDGYEVCKYHTFRNQTHGPRRPTECHKPKCILFDCWLDEPYKKCEACQKACAEVNKA